MKGKFAEKQVGRCGGWKETLRDACDTHVTTSTLLVNLVEVDGASGDLMVLRGLGWVCRWFDNIIGTRPREGWGGVIVSFVWQWLLDLERAQLVTVLEPIVEWGWERTGLCVVPLLSEPDGGGYRSAGARCRVWRYISSTGAFRTYLSSSFDFRLFRLHMVCRVVRWVEIHGHHYVLWIWAFGDREKWN